MSCLEALRISQLTIYLSGLPGLVGALVPVDDHVNTKCFELVIVLCMRSAATVSSATFTLLSTYLNNLSKRGNIHCRLLSTEGGAEFHPQRCPWSWIGAMKAVF